MDVATSDSWMATRRKLKETGCHQHLVVVDHENNEALTSRVSSALTSMAWPLALPWHGCCESRPGSSDFGPTNANKSGNGA